MKYSVLVRSILCRCYRKREVTGTAGCRSLVPLTTIREGGAGGVEGAVGGEGAGGGERGDRNHLLQARQRTPHSALKQVCK